VADHCLAEPNGSTARRIQDVFSRHSRRVWRWLGIPLALWWTVYVWRLYLPQGLPNLGDHLRPLTRFPEPLIWKPWWFDLVAAVGLGLVALCIGGWLLSRLPVELDRAERLLLAPASGFLVLVLAASALSLFGLFEVWPLRILVGLCLAIALPRIKTELKFVANCAASGAAQLRAEPEAALCLILAAPFFFFGVVASALPETSFDALNVYLYHPRLYLEHGSFHSVDLYRGFSPIYAQVFYALALAVKGPGLARFLNFLLLPGAALAVLLLTRRLAVGSRGLAAGSLAVLFLVSAPAVLYHATICYPDLALAFWTTVGLYALLRSLETDSRVWLALSGMCAGMAAGLKYAGLYAVVVLGVLLAGSTLRRGWRRAAGTVLIFGAIVVTVAGPWYLRNWYFTGDPVHPALYRMLARPAITGEEAAALLTDGMNFQRFPATSWNLLRLPWLITLEGDLLQGTIGPVFLWAFPVILLSLRRERIWWATRLACGAMALLFFLGPQWIRYFLPVVPLLCGLAAASVFQPGRRWLLPVALLLPLVNLTGLNSFWIGGGRNVLYQMPYEVVFGATSPEQYQRKEVSGFDAIQFWNRLPLPPETRVLPVPLNSFFPPALSRWPVVDLFENGRIVCRKEVFLDCYTMPPPELLASLDRHRVTVLALRPNLNYLTPDGAFQLEAATLRTGFRLIGQSGGTFLYQRRAGGPQAGDRYVNADLIHRWVTTNGEQLSPAAALRVSTYQPWGADQRLALVYGTATVAQWEVDLGRQPRLALSLSADSRRVVKVHAAAAGRTVSGACSAHAGGEWALCAIDLSALAGQRATISLEGSAVAVADAVIYAEETGEPPVSPPDPGGQLIFTANPNPVIVTDGSGLGVTRLTWNAPQASYVEIRIGAPDGDKLTYGGSSGSVATGKWVAVKEGRAYLLDVSDPARPKILASLKLRAVAGQSTKR